MQDRPLKVFFNASALPPRPAGAGVYTLQLGRALAAREDIELLFAAPGPNGFEQEIRTPSGHAARTRWEQFSLAALVRDSGCDVYHGPHMWTPRLRVPSVATVHDLTFFRLPGRYTRRHRWYYRYLASTAKRAGRVIVPSAAVAGDVVRYLGYPPEKIRVIAEAPRAGLAAESEAEIERFRTAHELSGPYLLCLGTAEPGKRAVDAIRAMPRVLGSAPGTVLCLAGNPGPLSGALEREVARLGLQANVRFLGYIEDGDLPALLTGAAALVFPSLYEGFGLPPLEAMACGTPVISSDAPAMREVLGDAAAFVPLRDPEAIAREATKLLGSKDLRAELSAAGLEFVRRYSWGRAAAETADVYRELAR